MKAMYYIINSDDEYFQEITKLNTILFTKDKTNATQFTYSETEELIPYIEFKTGKVASAEIV